MISKISSRQQYKYVRLRYNNALIFAKLADTHMTRIKGLMSIDSLPLNQGMLFDFKQRDQVRLWMKNCLIPISAVFLSDDLVTVGVSHMDHNQPTRVYKSPEPVRFVLEVTPETCKANNIKVGSRFEIIK